MRLRPSDCGPPRLWTAASFLRQAARKDLRDALWTSCFVLFFFLERKSLGGAGTIWQPLTWCYSLSVHSFSQLLAGQLRVVCLRVVCLRAVRVSVSLYVCLCDVECVYS